MRDTKKFMHKKFMYFFAPLLESQTPKRSHEGEIILPKAQPKPRTAWERASETRASAQEYRERVAAWEKPKRRGADRPRDVAGRAACREKGSKDKGKGTYTGKGRGGSGWALGSLAFGEAARRADAVSTECICDDGIPAANYFAIVGMLALLFLSFKLVFWVYKKIVYKEMVLYTDASWPTKSDLKPCVKCSERDAYNALAADNRKGRMCIAGNRDPWLGNEGVSYVGKTFMPSSVTYSAAAGACSVHIDQHCVALRAIKSKNVKTSPICKICMTRTSVRTELSLD